MRDSKRIARILAKLQQLWLTYPDMRLGQLVDNLAVKDGWSGCGALFNMEDDDLERVIDKLLVEGWR